jgi:hypothetical protein
MRRALLRHRSAAGTSRRKSEPAPATTAVSARWVAIFSAVVLSVHPSDENPTTARGAGSYRRGTREIHLLSSGVDRQAGRDRAWVEAQRKAVEDYLNGGRWTLLRGGSNCRFGKSDLLSWAANMVGFIVMDSQNDNNMTG